MSLSQPKANHSWLWVQSLALGLSLLVPVLAHVDSAKDEASGDPEVFEKTNLQERDLLASVEWQHFTAPAAIRMTSRVVSLPLPERVPSKGLRIDVDTAQVRFETAGEGEIGFVASRRAPASSGLWTLLSIERQPGREGAEKIRVMPSTESSTLSSTFVELSEGENVFHVTFQNARTRARVSYPVRIVHLRKRIS